MSEILTDDLTEGIVDGTGIFDELMKATSAHLDREYEQNRIKGSDYAKVYTAGMESVMAQSVQYLLGRQQADKQAELLHAQKLKTNEETLLVVQQVKNAIAGEDKTRQEIVNLKTQDILTKEQINKTIQEVVNLKTQDTLTKEQINKTIQEIVNLKTQDNLAKEQIEKTKAETSLVKKTEVKLDAEISLIEQQILKSIQEVLLLRKQVIKMDHEINLIEQQVLKMKQEILLIRKQIIKTDSEIDLINQQVLKAVEEILLIRNQASKILKDILLVIAQTSKTEAEEELIDAKKTTEKKMPSKVQAETDLINKNVDKTVVEIYLLKENIKEVIAKTVLLTEQAIKIQKELELLMQQIAIAMKEVILKEKEILIAEAKLAISIEQLKKMAAEILMIKAQILKIKQEVCTEKAQTQGSPTTFACVPPATADTPDSPRTFIDRSDLVAAEVASDETPNTILQPTAAHDCGDVVNGVHVPPSSAAADEGEPVRKDPEIATISIPEEKAFLDTKSVSKKIPVIEVSSAIEEVDKGSSEPDLSAPVSLGPKPSPVLLALGGTIDSFGCADPLGGLIGAQIDKLSRETLLLQKRLATEEANSTKTLQEAALIKQKETTEQKVSSKMVEEEALIREKGATEEATTLRIVQETALIKQKAATDKASAKKLEQEVLLLTKKGTSEIATSKKLMQEVNLLLQKCNTEKEIAGKLKEEADLLILKQWTEKAQVQSAPALGSIAHKALKLQDAQIDAFCNDTRLKASKAGIGPLMAKLASDPNWTDVSISAGSAGAFNNLGLLAMGCNATITKPEDFTYGATAASVPGVTPAKPTIIDPTP